MEKGLLIVIGVIALIAFLGHLKQQRGAGGRLWSLRTNEENERDGEVPGRITTDDDDLAAMLAKLERMERRLSVVERLADLPEAPPSPPRRPLASDRLRDDRGTPLSIEKSRADQSPR